VKGVCVYIFSMGLPVLLINHSLYQLLRSVNSCVDIIMKATAKDLRFYSGRLLAKVSQGEEVIITHRGKPCAKLVPLDGAVSKTMTDDGLFGI
jgi:prevent-host-death family protein